jgi:hypothetical protein
VLVGNDKSRFLQLVYCDLHDGQTIGQETVVLPFLIDRLGDHLDRLLTIAGSPHLVRPTVQTVHHATVKVEDHSFPTELLDQQALCPRFGSHARTS